MKPAVDVFDRRDGTGADWVLIAASLFRVAFDVADERLDDHTRRRFMQRVYTDASDRAAGNFEASNPERKATGQGKTGASSSKRAASKGHKPRPRR